MNSRSSTQTSYDAPGWFTCHCRPKSLPGVMAPGEGDPHPESWRISVNGMVYLVHVSVRLRSVPKSLKHSLQTLPSGSVLTSGTLRRTLLDAPGPFLAQKEIPLYLLASYAALGSWKFKPIPAKR